MANLDRLWVAEQASLANAARRVNFFIFLRDAFKVIAPGKLLAEDLYLEALAFELQQAASADGGRLIVTMPPRYLKSIAASIALPSWILGRAGTTKILVAGYADTLATEHARAFRALVTSSYYKQVFPSAKIAPLVNQANQFTTKNGGERRAVTVGGSVTGIGGDLIVIEDIMKAAMPTPTLCAKASADTLTKHFTRD